MGARTMTIPGDEEQQGGEFFLPFLNLLTTIQVCIDCVRLHYLYLDATMNQWCGSSATSPHIWPPPQTPSSILMRRRGSRATLPLRTPPSRHDSDVALHLVRLFAATTTIFAPDDDDDEWWHPFFFLIGIFVVVSISLLNIKWILYYYFVIIVTH
jgi:hypothetical protein